ncbi:MAG TPA: hypothetical protein VGF06_09035 [Terriglobales bacterium]
MASVEKMVQSRITEVIGLEWVVAAARPAWGGATPAIIAAS